MNILYTKCSLYEFFTLCCMIFLHFGCFGSRKIVVIYTNVKISVFVQSNFTQSTE